LTEETLKEKLDPVVKLIEETDIQPVTPGDLILKKETLETLSDTGFTLPITKHVAVQREKKPRTKERKKPQWEKSPYGHRVGTMAAKIDSYVKKELTSGKEEISMSECETATGIHPQRVKIHLKYLIKKKGIEFKLVE
jgi:hypothetical protein